MREETIKSKILGEVISKRKKIQLQKVCIIKKYIVKNKMEIIFQGSGKTCIFS